MTKLLLSASTLALVLTVSAIAGDHDTCTCPSKTAMTVSFCKPCGGGVAFTHKTKSEKLIGALAGSEVNDKTHECCKKAATTNASCCGKTFVNHKGYHSPVSAAMAHGKIVDAGKVACDGCKSAVKAGEGFCAGCKVGVIHGIKFAGQESYDAARQAHTVLTKAIKAADHCEACAVAMVTDGECSHCKVKFKGGEVSKG